MFMNDSHGDYSLGSCQHTACLLKYDGQVNCLFPCHQSAKCKGNFTDWPYDIQTCSVVFQTSLTRTEAEFDPESLGGVRLENISNQWNMLNVTASMNRGQEKNVKFSFVLQRKFDSLMKHVIVLGYSIIVLTLSILWMRNDNSMRLIMSGVCIYLCFSLMDRVTWQ